MGVTHGDFFRLLPGAMRDHPYQVLGQVVNAEVFGGSVRIELGDEQIRQIALLSIPFCEVTFSYTNISSGDYERFRRDFELSFQRGGG